MASIAKRLTDLERQAQPERGGGGLFIVPDEILRDPAAMAKLAAEAGVIGGVFLPQKEPAEDGR